MMEPTIVVSEKKIARCTAGHDWSWDDRTFEGAPVWLVVDGKAFCLRCIGEKLLKAGVGQEAD